ncbi:hypothetical protein [Lysobacter sp. A3-1-A15]|uniref:hypothetical protein n=1 Tax=Novilysobacter viscosus TaxID=3098602 RepID=UPI002EDA2E57
MASEARPQPRTIVALLVGATVIALLAGWMGARMAGGTGGGAMSALTGQPAAAGAADRLAALEQRVERIAVQMDRLAGATASGRPRPALAAAPVESVESDAELAQSQRKMVQSLATQFDAESVDPRWSASAEAALRRIGSSDAILSIEAQPPDRQVIDCRRTRCRMEFDFADNADAEDWTLAYLTSLGGTLSRSQYFVSKGPTGSTRITLYGQR